MEKSMIDRWIDAVKPFDMGKIRKDFISAYASALGMGPEMKERVEESLKKAVSYFDDDESRKIVKVFAEEHFSDAALEKAVLFFESPEGKKYLDERLRVVHGAMGRINTLLAESVRRAFEGGGGAE